METSITKKKMRNSAKTGKFIVWLLVFHFLFFGAIANIYEKDVGDKVLFVYKNFYSVESWFTLLILILIFISVAFSEDFLVDGIKNCLKTVPYLVFFSITWYLINGLGDFDVVLIERLYTPFLEYFISWEGYVNIIILLIISVGSGLLGGFLKIKLVEYRKSKRRIEE